MAKKDKQAKKPAENCRSKQTVDKPQSREKAVMAAYVVSLGGTMADAAEAAGCSERTVRSWKDSEWWREALDEAAERWKGEALARAKYGLLRALHSGDAATVRWLLERMMPATFPAPTHRHDVDLNANVSAKAEVRVYLPDNQRGPTK
jgi:hypothetical protein